MDPSRLFMRRVLSMFRRFLVVPLALTVISSCRCDSPKKVVKLTLSDLVVGGEARVRAGCEALFSNPGEVLRCVRSNVNSAVIVQLCDRARLDGGIEQCVSFMRVSGAALVLETVDTVYLVVDGASALDM